MFYLKNDRHLKLLYGIAALSQNTDLSMVLYVLLRYISIIIENLVTCIYLDAYASLSKDNILQGEGCYFVNIIYFTSLTDFTFPLGLVLNSRAWLFASGIE